MSRHIQRGKPLHDFESKNHEFKNIHFILYFNPSTTIFKSYLLHRKSADVRHWNLMPFIRHNTGSRTANHTLCDCLS